MRVVRGRFACRRAAHDAPGGPASASKDVLVDLTSGGVAPVMLCQCPCASMRWAAGGAGPAVEAT